MGKVSVSRRVWAALVGGLAACLLAACGGPAGSVGTAADGSSGAGDGLLASTPGSIAVAIAWPPRPAAGRLIPDAAESVKIEVLSGATTAHSKVLVRGEASASITGITPGTYTVRATACPLADGTGTGLAMATLPAEIKPAEVKSVDLTLSSTIATVAIEPAPGVMPVDGTCDLNLVARDSGNQVILLPSVTWSSEPSGSIEFAASGTASRATAKTPGNATIRASVKEQSTDASSLREATASVPIPPYQLVRLGTFGASSSAAVAVNAGGTVLVYVTAANARLWRDGTVTELPNTATLDYHRAIDLNDAGTAVGSLGDFAPGSPDNQSWLWVWNGSAIGTIGLLTDGESRWSDPIIIVNDGTIIAHELRLTSNFESWFSPQYLTTPYPTSAMGHTGQVPYSYYEKVLAANNATPRVELRSESGTYKVGSNVLQGGFPVDLNDAGQVCGYASVGGQNHAARWDSPATPIDLGALGGGVSSGYAISGGGQVVGDSLAADNRSRAFIHNGTAMIDLGSVEAGTSQALAINASGVIVGWVDPAGSAPQEAVVWKPIPGALSVTIK